MFQEMQESISKVMKCTCLLMARIMVGVLTALGAC